MKEIDIREISHLIPRFSPDHHKGTGGTSLLVAGSVGFAGAAALSATAAYRSGAGIVRCIIPERIYEIVSTLIPEAVFSPLGDEETLLESAINEILLREASSKAILVGCGLGNNKKTKALTKRILKETKIPLILDADGLNCLSDCIEYIAERDNTIITPHPGEAARLLGIPINEIQENREKYARVLAQKTNSVTVLKGHNTIITSPTGEECFCPYGNAGMGKGGSGDILAGMITSFVTQGLRLFDAAVLGVTLHALAGDAAAEKFSENSMLPTDLINALPEVFKKYI